ncbi:AAA family ATPase [Planomonospora sp. ID91781]|uniref:McrB family protein n=1 Tax=Planomonospora sp. ID91781 TaxID=2738135 RepID=UPI0018C3F25B|nr:AAA family ATPase [Planomonospora sp. ID91781]MBG0823913.1 AAA family ATPase [Planomonospora sp. ID91781]
MSAERHAIVCTAAQQVFRTGILTGRSAFAPGLEAWTLPAARELLHRFVENYDGSADEFLVKLKRQISDASDEAVVLAAELLYVNLVPLNAGTVGPDRKFEIIETVLSWTPRRAAIPADLAEAASTGSIKGGQAFLNYRWAQFAFLIRVTVRLLESPAAERERLLGDPWAFRDLAREVFADHDGKYRARSQLHILLFLLFPDTYEPIASERHKQLIRDAFADRLAGPAGDVDRDLAEIRRRLEQESGRPVGFYAEPWRSKWHPPEQPRPQKGWLVRGANVKDVNVIPRWLEEGFCSVAWAEADEIAAGASREEIGAVVTTAYPDAVNESRSAHVRQLSRFLTEMQPGDLVATVDGDTVYVGKVTGDAFYDDTDGRDLARRRPVEWSTESPLSRRRLSEAAQARLRDRRTVVDLTRVMAELAAEAGLDDEVTDDVKIVDETQALVIPMLTEAFADDLLMPPDWLRETADLLVAKRQLILYGPPGTGKTFLAIRLAEELAGPERTDLVQFHPSYGYEDFVEGFRPRPAANGTIGFELVPGPFKRAVEAAEAEPGKPFVLVIDEINRADLAKVFGELYFLLEYRNREISLQYSPHDKFKLPENVFVIGTMNTVDRSVALVDAAMRRRFAFRALAPDRPPVDGLLRRWLTRENLPDAPARLLDEVNRRLADPDRAVGPSYLMTRQAAHRRGLERIWATEILPLLEDQLYGSGIDVEQEYGLAALLEALGIDLP